MPAFCQHEFRKLYERGITRNEIASRLNISQDTITRYVNKLGLKKRGPAYIRKKYWTPERNAKLVEMYDQGVAVKDIAAYFNRDKSVICARASFLGIKRQKDTWTDERVKLLKKLWSEGLSGREIADQLGGGISRNAVIGKINRLKLSKQRENYKKGSLTRRKPRKSHPIEYGRPQVVKIFQPKADQIEPLPPENSNFTIDFSDLKDNMCRNVTGTGPYKYCGRPTGGETYCRACKEKIYQRVKRHAG